jgi:hypothetical protein
MTATAYDAMPGAGPARRVHLRVHLMRCMCLTA